MSKCLETRRLKLETDAVSAQAAFQKSNRRIIVLAVVILALDQIAKALLLRSLGEIPGDERVIIPGFFKFVHWGNTGAAWSLFNGNNGLLALFALFALVALFLTRHHFDSNSLMGQIAFGLIFGGIAGTWPTACFAAKWWTSSGFIWSSGMAVKSVFPPSTSPIAQSAPAWP